MQFPSDSSVKLSMHLETSVFVHRPAREIWTYLGDISNIAAWDRGVSRAETTRSTAQGPALEFDTYAHSRGRSTDGSWGKMSYCVVETDPVRGCTVQLTSTEGNARYFQSAEWRFRVEAEESGSRVFCAAVFTLKWQYLFLAPLFYGMKRAIRRDLEQFRLHLESRMERESESDRR